MAGTLYIVSTPIGNLKDITLRALEIIQSVDYLLVEDTRVTGKLLSHYRIKKVMISLCDFNEESRIPMVIGDLKGGKNIGLISDAGTPLISDPGFKLVREAIKSEIKVESVPGPSAVISAITVSGLPSDKFLFLGYLPKKEGRRKKLLLDVKAVFAFIRPTVIIYESPYRLIKTLSDINSVFGDVDIVICREMTKVHEEVIRDKVSSVVKLIADKVRGEFVILF